MMFVVVIYVAFSLILVIKSAAISGMVVHVQSLVAMYIAIIINFDCMRNIHVQALSCILLTTMFTNS